MTATFVDVWNKLVREDYATLRKEAAAIETLSSIGLFSGGVLIGTALLGEAVLPVLLLLGAALFLYSREWYVIGGNLKRIVSPDLPGLATTASSVWSGKTFAKQLLEGTYVYRPLYQEELAKTLSPKDFQTFFVGQLVRALQEGRF